MKPSSANSKSGSNNSRNNVVSMRKKSIMGGDSNNVVDLTLDVCLLLMVVFQSLIFF